MAETMKMWQKVVLASFGVAVVGAVALSIVTYWQVTRAIPDLYAQWASAEMVITFRKDMDRMPVDWDELAPFYGSNSPHNGGLSFEQIRERIVIDFPELPKLELDPANGAVPEVIITASGIQSHWDGAEPNQLVNQEVRK